MLRLPMKRAQAMPRYGWQNPSSSKSSLREERGGHFKRLRTEIGTGVGWQELLLWAPSEEEMSGSQREATSVCNHISPTRSQDGPQRPRLTGVLGGRQRPVTTLGASIRIRRRADEPLAGSSCYRPLAARHNGGFCQRGGRRGFGA
ncbi:hypothetical protein EYF80_044846 [Liparis tanakae]|uniref:Uncharacterized protein n=1 Tax=Liparis tanakae TaxID=230148 RepID=A0A4Z2FWH8_9TELE|nr:hypothetical protein EYF80_044846 [Liparis tanakae]